MMQEKCKIENLYNLDETIAKEIFNDCTYPWEVLPKIKNYIIDLGNSLDLNIYNKIGENIWIAKSATVAPTAFITGPTIIGENTEVRHCAFIRGNAIVGNNCVVGNSTELKNVVLPEMQKKAETFGKMLEEYNSGLPDSALKLSSAGGAAAYDPALDVDFKSVFKRADEEMYRCKAEYYKRFGDRRKHRDETS